MDARRKIAVGSVLATFGGAAIALGAVMGVSTLGTPWSFVAGFVAGVLTGSGAVLAIAGLVECR